MLYKSYTTSRSSAFLHVNKRVEHFQTHLLYIIITGAVQTTINYYWHSAPQSMICIIIGLTYS